MDNNIYLTDLIDAKMLQEIQDGFARLTGMAALTCDHTGNPVTEGSNFTDYCMKYTRCSAEGKKRCENCDKMGGINTKNTGHAEAYDCHAGLTDFAAPIMLNGQFLGSFIGGQVLTEQPDDVKYWNIAEELDIDPKSYVEAVHKVKVLPRAQVDNAVAFLETLAKVLSEIAFENHHTRQTNENLKAQASTNQGVIRDVKQVAEATMKAVSEMNQHFATLAELADKSKAEVDSCTGTVALIEDNATTTHILGLNAAIEASRAKEHGKGFGVIAQEVRSLADVSKSSADEIKGQIGEVAGMSERIAARIAESKQLAEQCMKDIARLKDIMRRIDNGSSFDASDPFDMQRAIDLSNSRAAELDKLKEQQPDHRESRK